jgi:hypothetical protein
MLILVVLLPRPLILLLAGVRVSARHGWRQSHELCFTSVCNRLDPASRGNVRREISKHENTMHHARLHHL